MTVRPRACSPDTTLAAAATLMWEGDCGVLLVLDDGERHPQAANDAVPADARRAVA